MCLVQVYIFNCKTYGCLNFILMTSCLKKCRIMSLLPFWFFPTFDFYGRLMISLHIARQRASRRAAMLRKAFRSFREFSKAASPLFYPTLEKSDLYFRELMFDSK